MMWLVDFGSLASTLYHLTPFVLKIALCTIAFRTPMMYDATKTMNIGLLWQRRKDRGSTTWDHTPRHTVFGCVYRFLAIVDDEEPDW